jgi:prepilin-type N-terminal cleavage/methylation domain-containing protein
VTHFRPTRRVRRGLTLLEVVLAMGLLTMLSSLTYWFYSSTLESRRQGVGEAQRIRLARVVLDRIVREIRQTAMITSDAGASLQGDAEQIRLTTLRTPDRDQVREQLRYKESARVAYDVVKVAYHIVRHPDIKHDDGYELPLGLGRMEARVPRPAHLAFGEAFADEQRRPPANEDDASADEEADDVPEDEAENELSDTFLDALFGDDDESVGVGAAAEINWEELYSPEVKYLRFCYFDGSKWWDSWHVQGESPLPQMVQVTLGFEGQAPFGEEFESEENEEFCTCLNEDPVDCERLGSDQVSRVVRLVQSDPLFRSRITREGQAFMDKMLGEEPAP